MQIDRGDLLDHFKKAVGLLQLLDLVGEIELFDDLPRPRGEAGHKLHQIGCELVRVAEELAEGEIAGVVEGHFELRVAEFPVDHLLDGLRVIFARGLQLLVLGDDLILSLLQHAIQPAQHRERDHHPAILRRPVRAAQEIGDVPDNITVFFEGFEAFHECVFRPLGRKKLLSTNRPPCALTNFSDCTNMPLRSAAWVVNASLVEGEHLNEQAHNTVRRVELPPFLPLALDSSIK